MTKWQTDWWERRGVCACEVENAWGESGYMFKLISDNAITKAWIWEEERGRCEARADVLLHVFSSANQAETED